MERVTGIEPALSAWEADGVVFRAGTVNTSAHVKHTKDDTSRHLTTVDDIS